MESNLFIKSYKTEGNKVKDIQFYGDWVIETGGGGSSEVIVGTTDGINSGTIPSGITATFTVVNDNSYKVRFWNKTGARVIVYRINGDDDYSLTINNNYYADFCGTKDGTGDIKELRLAIQKYNSSSNGDIIGYVYADYENGITEKGDN